MGIFILLFTNLVYCINDSLNVADSSISIPKKINNMRTEKGAIDWSSGLIFGKGWTVRVKFHKFAVQGSFAILPDIQIIGGSRGNNYYFGFACSYDIVYIPYSRFYISAGSSFSINYLDERKWYVGIAPMFDFSIPKIESVSFNCGFGFSYVLRHIDIKLLHTILIKPEIGLYFRIF